jgi:hypothetical protein
MLGETDFPFLPLPGSDLKSDLSDFGDCVTIELLDLLTEPLSLEIGVPGGTDVPLPLDFNSDLEVGFTDSGECMTILELLLEAVCLETGVPDTVTVLAFCSNSGEDENFLVVGE